MSLVPAIVLFELEHAGGVAAVYKALGWASYADEEIARRGCMASGCVTTVALAADDLGVVGFAQVLSDGVVQAFLAQVGVLPGYRRRGTARELIQTAFLHSGAQRLDLLTDDAQSFYRSFPHKEKSGFRIYPTSP